MKASLFCFKTLARKIPFCTRFKCQKNCSIQNCSIFSNIRKQIVVIVLSDSTNNQEEQKSLNIWLQKNWTVPREISPQYLFDIVSSLKMHNFVNLASAWKGATVFMEVSVVLVVHSGKLNVFFLFSLAINLYCLLYQQFFSYRTTAIFIFYCRGKRSLLTNS